MAKSKTKTDYITELVTHVETNAKRLTVKQLKSLLAKYK